MKIVTTGELTAGMITAQAVRTRSGQVIVKADTILTSQMINRLDFYRIKKIAVVSDEAIPAPVIPISPDVILYQETAKNNIEFKHFKKTFHEKVDILEQYMNHIITQIEPENQKSLLSQTIELFQETSEKINIFEMLHCIRRIDDSTYAHSINVAILCRLMGQWLDFSREDTDVLTLAGLLHDIGKCQIPHSVMSKPTKLTPSEYHLVKQHPLSGYTILKNHPLDPRIKRAALMHHERSDGSGYPMGLVAEDIDPFATIVSIADVYDAMTTNRCYREALCPFEVIAAFEREGFGKYNSHYANTFLSHIVDSYMNNQVQLNDGSYGKIVLKNRSHLARPMIYSEDNRFIDLGQHPDLFIQALV